MEDVSTFCRSWEGKDQSGWGAPMLQKAKKFPLSSVPTPNGV